MRLHKIAEHQNMMKTFSIIRACIGLLSAECYAKNAAAFNTFLLPHKEVVRSPYKCISSALRATIYYPDGFNDEYDVNEDFTIFKHEAAYTNYNKVNEAQLSQLADRLCGEDQAAVLARLASAYSPSDYSIDLPNISSARCLCVDNKHLEIEAVVCDNHECSTLLVPVYFPNECTLDDGLENCVLGNVLSLDEQGDHLIQERISAFADEEEAQRAYDVFKLVGDSEYLRPSPTKLPEWWVPPTSSEDVAECNMIEKLLNEPDWQLEMQGLCKQALQESGETGIGYEDKVQHARVKVIGPEGMVLEATILRRGKSTYDYGGINNVDIINVPIKFASKGDSGSASIRDHVLRVVSSVSA